jgi:hypothetical protein
MSAIQESIKEMTVEELLSLIAAATAEAKKKAKGSKAAKEPKGSKEPKAPKKGSMVKGVLPPQLHESFAWVDFVLADAKANGWTAYAVKGKEEMEEASEERDGAHVFPTTGKEFNRKNAMSLSKFYFSKKEGKGAKEELYQQFAAQYVAPAAPASPSPDAVAKAVTEAVTEAMAVSPIASPVASPKKKAKAEPKATPAPKATKAKAAPAAPKKKKVEDEWLTTCPKDDAVYPWDFEGVKYARNYKGYVYSVDEDGEPAYWVGLFNGTEIDKSVAEPEE